jgi:GNAT superfamily N-acetyltransferase
MHQGSTFRFAESADVEAVTRLVNAAFAVERFFIDGDRITVEETHQRLRKGKFLLSEDRDVLAGCIYVELRGERGYFGLVSIDPSRQRSGLGSKLVAAAEEYFRANACRFADLLVVNLRTELPPFYRRLGYAELGIEPFSPEVRTKLPCHFIRMSKPLAS